MKVAIVGASGYAGGELLRILIQHPKFHVTEICAGSNAGELITSIHPHLQEFNERSFTSVDTGALNNCDLVFMALPHGESSKLISAIDSKVKVVDLGADFRLESSASWNSYYNTPYAGFLPYGLPELASSEIYASNQIANPGCYATAIAIGAAPLLKIQSINSNDLVVVAASGTTGAGRGAKVNLLASEVMNNLTSYKFGGIHQHTPEIEQALNSISNKNVTLSFTPILAPMPRGILATLTARFDGNLTYSVLKDAFTDLYRRREFIKFLPEGQLPNTSAVYGSNYVHIQAAVDTHASRVVVSVAIDNLGKGAAGQAIQNANLMFGFEESLGLLSQGVK